MYTTLFHYLRLTLCTLCTLGTVTTAYWRRFPATLLFRVISLQISCAMLSEFCNSVRRLLPSVTSRRLSTRTSLRTQLKVTWLTTLVLDVKIWIRIPKREVKGVHTECVTLYVFIMHTHIFVLSVQNMPSCSQPWSPEQPKMWTSSSTLCPVKSPQQQCRLAFTFSSLFFYNCKIFSSTSCMYK